MDKILKQFAESLQRIRKNQGLSQEKLAELTGLHRTYISDLECGRRNPSIITLVKLSQALSVTLVTLLKDVHDA
jgi:transcriptional regulator with XRE-family HTH domain